jgi:hypothetical protein
MSFFTMREDPEGRSVIHLDAAGIDIGNESHYVAVPPNRDCQSVERFGCTTAERKLKNWNTPRSLAQNGTSQIGSSKASSKPPALYFVATLYIP